VERKQRLRMRVKSVNNDRLIGVPVLKDLPVGKRR